MPRLYIDTNIIVDAVDDRKNLFGKNIGAPARQLFLEAISCKHSLIISTLTLNKLGELGLLENAKMFFEMIKSKTHFGSYNSSEESQAEARFPANKWDALHIIIAERENADYIVTRDAHFSEIGTRISLVKPGELL